ncbi:MAG: alkaline phosphatase D family protein [Myxococcota bacterium]
MRSFLLLLAVLLAACPPPRRPPPAEAPEEEAREERRGTVRTHLGPILGDLQAASVVLWARAERAATLHAQIWRRGTDADHLRQLAQEAIDASDRTAQVRFDGLVPATTYHYRAWFGGPEERTAPDDAAEGLFRTAPRPSESAPLRFAFGGDLAGQNVCRDREEGFPIFEPLARRRQAFFLGLGDMIYGDGRCDEVGRYGNAQVAAPFVESARIEDFWAHWRYAREDLALQKFLERTPYVAVWDDHEVANDFGPDDPLAPIGLRAFLHHNPVDAGASAGRRLHRALRYGKNVELLVLDTRQHRDSATLPDLDDAPKTLLGREQRAWLEGRLRESDARWLVVASSVPIGIPTGSEQARDGWADGGNGQGYERELGALFEVARENRRNLLFLTTDVHFATVLRYTPFPDDPAFVVHEVVVGPLNAGIYPREDLDETFAPERLFFHQPGDPTAISTWEEAKAWFTFGEIDVDWDGYLRLRVLGVDGGVLFEKSLRPPQAGRSEAPDTTEG